MQIHIPTPLRAFTDKQETVSVSATTVAGGLEQLVQQHPAMRAHLFTAEGKLRSFVNVYLNDEDVRYLPAKEETPVADADELTIIPSIAGGKAVDLLGGADQDLYSRTLAEVAAAGAVPNPVEDMKHAHMLLSGLSPVELLQVTLILEDFVEQTPAFQQKMQALSNIPERLIPMDETLAEYGLSTNEQNELVPSSDLTLRVA